MTAILWNLSRQINFSPLSTEESTKNDFEIIPFLLHSCLRIFLLFYEKRVCVWEDCHCH